MASPSTGLEDQREGHGHFLATESASTTAPPGISTATVTNPTSFIQVSSASVSNAAAAPDATETRHPHISITGTSHSTVDALATEESHNPIIVTEVAPSCGSQVDTTVEKATDSKKGTQQRKSVQQPVETSHDEGVSVTNFPHSRGLTTAEAEELIKKFGKNELVEKRTPSWLIYIRGLWGPMPIAIWIAVIVEFALQNFPDAGILLAILFTNATISWYETMKAGNAVAALKKSLKPSATVKRDGQWKTIDATLLVPGDLVLLGSGSAVPADCRLHDCQIDVDEAALTGESLPVAMTEGFRPKMGSNVVRGEGEATVEFTGANTFFGRTAAMLQSVGIELGGIQKLLIRVMVILTSLSFVLVLTAFIYLLVHVNTGLTQALQFSVVLLVASIPIAIEIVVTTTLAMGSRQLATWKAIVTHLTSIEALAGMNMLCSDKTGTLTMNKMEIQDDCPTFLPGHNKDTVLILAALAAKWKEPPRDALDTMVLGSADLKECDKYTQLSYTPFDPVMKRTEANIQGPNGVTFRVTKGAPHVVLKLCHNKEEIEERVDTIVHRLAESGTRSLCVAKTNHLDQWEIVGILTFLDPPRPDTKNTIEKAWENGIFVKMITGDHAIIAKEMARRLGLGRNILSAEHLPTFPKNAELPHDLGEKYGAEILAADGFAQVFPEHKFMIVEALRQYGFTCGMTGDGVNDAPALKRADIGIAVSGATDAARAAADIVLTAPGLSVIIEAILIARSVFNRIRSFMTYRISATLQLVSFFFVAVFALPPSNYQPYDTTTPNNASDPNGPSHPSYSEQWPAFFSIPVLMLMLITLLNDGTLLTIGYDNVRPSKNPQKWNLPALFTVAAVMAGVTSISSLILLYGALDSWNPNSWFQLWGLPPMEYGKIVSMIYLNVSVLDFLTLFASRVADDFFWTQRPAKILLIGALSSLSLSTILASVWPDGYTSGIHVTGLAIGGTYSKWPLWVWIYCIIWWFIQDLAKVATYKILSKYDIFRYRTLASVMAFNQFQDGGGDLAAAPQTSISISSVDFADDHHTMKKLEKAAENMERRASKGSDESGIHHLNHNAQNMSNVKETDV